MVASIPAALTMTLTNFYNRKKHNAEIQKIHLEGKGSEAANMEAIFQNYNLVLTQTKIELADVNKRFSDYIEDANRRALMNKTRISRLEEDNKRLSNQVTSLMNSLNALNITGVDEEGINNFKDDKDISEY